MIRSYKYFGNSIVEADDVVLKKFGQEYKIADRVALELARHGSGILLTETFDQMGFMPTHLKDRRERKPSNQTYMDAHKRAMVAQIELTKFLSNEINGAATAATS